LTPSRLARAPLTARSARRPQRLVARLSSSPRFCFPLRKRASAAAPDTRALDEGQQCGRRLATRLITGESAALAPGELRTHAKPPPCGGFRHRYRDSNPGFRTENSSETGLCARPRDRRLMPGRVRSTEIGALRDTSRDTRCGPSNGCFAWEATVSDKTLRAMSISQTLSFSHPVTHD
jgi:hypothetical protein